MAGAAGIFGTGIGGIAGAFGMANAAGLAPGGLLAAAIGGSSGAAGARIPPETIMVYSLGPPAGSDSNGFFGGAGVGGSVLICGFHVGVSKIKGFSELTGFSSACKGGAANSEDAGLGDANNWVKPPGSFSGASVRTEGSAGAS